MYKCTQCGETNKEKMMHKGGGRKCKSLCKLCHNRNVQERGLENKRKAIEYKGGKCQICGYKKSVSALEFHHKNASEKDHNFKHYRYWKFDRIKIELDKCILLCANCHREQHDVGG